MIEESGHTEIPNSYMKYWGRNTDGENAVYLYFCKWRNQRGDGYVEASVSTIAKYMGIDPKTVKRAILALIRKGWIKDILRSKETGNRDAKNRYLINNTSELNEALLRRELALRKSKGGGSIFEPGDDRDITTPMDSELIGTSDRDTRGLVLKKIIGKERKEKSIPLEKDKRDSDSHSRDSLHLEETKALIEEAKKRSPLYASLDSFVDCLLN
jgi:hypothetical protein